MLITLPKNGVRALLVCGLLCLCLTGLHAQVAPSSAADYMGAIQQRQQMAQNSVVAQYPARSIGPVVQGARITDLAVNPDKPKEFYVAFASGGVYKTTNNGTVLNPVFDNVGALTIGDIALAPSDPEVLYVGTGENNSSRSSYAGSGVYRSNDGGATWQHLGLDNIQHTGRIIVHPDDPNTVWVAAMGALYSHNPERGVYKSTDGGQNWKKTLFVNDSTGAIDLLIHPENPNVLYASMWERTRRAQNFSGEGLGSGLYRSDDGGNTWTKSMDGIPQTKGTGRIGIDLCLSQPDIMYAILDNQDKQAPSNEDEDDADEGLDPKDVGKMKVKDFLKLDDAELKDFLSSYNFPAKYTPKGLKELVKKGTFTPKQIAEYTGNANDDLTNTQVKGAELYKSTNGGKTWVKTHDYVLEGLVYTYGYYFGEVRVNPQDPDQAFLFGVPLIVTNDGGKTFARADTIGNVHSDHHSMWINPQDPEHIILGNDGGLYISYDGAATWEHINNTSVGQFYTVNVDMEKPYNVYGGLQDNGTLFGSSRSVPGRSNFWERIYGGDGMYVNPDPRNSQLVYAGLQFGNYWRIDRQKGEYAYITPMRDIGEPALRWNWRTPMILSSHNPDIVYVGAQKVFRSMNQGREWKAISSDLTKNEPQGNVPHNTITVLSESPKQFGLLYAGTDDGLVWVTRSGGTDWQNISQGLPANLWVSSVQASPHNEGTVFVTLNGYRFDNFGVYVYKSTDYGKTWQDISNNLPYEATNIVLQDPVNPDLLYCGTDHGAYVSMNGGNAWQRLTNIPNVACYDMIVHPRDNELVVATHGRSMWVMDVEPMQAVAGAGVEKFNTWNPDRVRYSSRWGQKRNAFTTPYKPSTTIKYYNNTARTNLKATVSLEDGTTVRTLEAAGEQGFGMIKWDLKNADDAYVKKGKYTVTFSAGKKELGHATVTVK